MSRKICYLLVALATFTSGTFLTLNQQKDLISTQKTAAETSVLLADSNNETAPDYVCVFGLRNPSLENQPVLIDFDDLKIKNIGLDSKEYSLRKKFGRALLSDETRDSFNKDMWFKTISYEGIEFGLLSVQNRRIYQVYEVEITSPNWVTKSGIKIGDDIKSVSEKFDTSNYREARNSEITPLYFETTGGSATFDFQNNKLVRIHWRYNLNLL